MQTPKQTAPPTPKNNKQAPGLVDGFERMIIGLEFKIEKGEVD